VRSVKEVVQRASPERYSSPFNSSPFVDGKDVGRRLSPYDRRQPPLVNDFGSQHNVAGGGVVKPQPEARLSVR
jgi:hypothetical protein